MPHETLPADIAEALNAYRHAVKVCAQRPVTDRITAEGNAYRGLCATILSHINLRAEDKPMPSAFVSGLL